MSVTMFLDILENIHWMISLFFYSPKIVIIQIRSMECRTPFLISIKCKFLVTGLLHMNCNSWKYHQRRTLARAFARNMTRKKEGKMRMWKIARKFHKTTYLIFVAALILMFLRRTFIFQHNNFILLKQEMQQKNSSKLFATTWRCYLMLLWPVLRYL